MQQALDARGLAISYVRTCEIEVDNMWAVRSLASSHLALGTARSRRLVTDKPAITTPTVADVNFTEINGGEFR